jgi:hypothetical protein
MSCVAHRVVHLERHTGDPPGARRGMVSPVDLLESARAGDETAFERLLAPSIGSFYRRNRSEI